MSNEPNPGKNTKKKFTNINEIYKAIRSSMKMDEQHIYTALEKMESERKVHLK